MLLICSTPVKTRWFRFRFSIFFFRSFRKNFTKRIEFDFQSVEFENRTEWRRSFRFVDGLKRKWFVRFFLLLDFWSLSNVFSSSGQIEFDEFCRVMGETLFKKYSQQELRQAFNQFDSDRSGYIQSNELENILRKMGRRYNSEQIDELIKSLDSSGDGKIGFDEFSKLFD